MNERELNNLKEQVDTNSAMIIALQEYLNVRWAANTIGTLKAVKNDETAQENKRSPRNT